MATFTPSHSVPASVSRHRYFHVVGTSVWVSDVPHESGWPAHFLGMLGDEACWGVDVPAGDDPADGAALDLYSFFGRSGEVEWLVAGRAVQLVEWARTHRFCDVVVQLVGGLCANAVHGHRSARVKPREDRMRRMNLLFCNV